MLALLAPGQGAQTPGMLVPWLDDDEIAATLAAFVECGGSLEATARALFVHPNTVRYRLRRVTDLTGFVASDPRDRWALSLALSFGRLDLAAPGTQSL